MSRRSVAADGGARLGFVHEHRCNGIRATGWSGASPRTPTSETWTVYETTDEGATLEGLNILQPGPAQRGNEPVLFASDFIDFPIYVDADPADLEGWYMQRFYRLRETAFPNQAPFFKRSAAMSRQHAGPFGLDNWQSINLPNLVENIRPTRSRAHLILTKGSDHLVHEVLLRLM